VPERSIVSEALHETLDPAGWHAEIASARRRGEYLEAIDLARKGLEAHPGDLRLEYEKTLAYARAGATNEAEANLLMLRKAGALDGATDRDLLIDFGALSARLLKDRAYGAPHDVAPPLAGDAAAAYEAVFDATGAYFPGINAATLWRMAGDQGRSERLARSALKDAQAAPPGYWAAATIAEAQILLGNADAAEAALRGAMSNGVHLDEIAATRRQLEWLLDYGVGDPRILAALPAPTVVIWNTETSFRAADMSQVGSFVASRPADRRPVLAYGAIIGIADIAASEAFLAAGARVHLVIACVAVACIAAVGERFGPAWADRLRNVMANAASVSEVTLEGDPVERTVAAMARQQASGLAAMRATALVTTVHRIRLGDAAMPSDADELPAPLMQERVARAFVFGDIKGFSTIPEAAHRPFLDYVIGGFADVLAAMGGEVEYAETAGDGIFVVVASIVSALRCCDGLQRVMEPERVAAAGLPATLALRLGAHIGPAARGLDRVTGRYKFIGKEVIRTARIEAVTPVGRTYVTEQFAATLHASSSVGHACEYVGWQAMAKGFGHCRMYSLRPTPQILTMLVDKD
jgi:adenylate cyclase